MQPQVAARLHGHHRVVQAIWIAFAQRFEYLLLRVSDGRIEERLQAIWMVEEEGAEDQVVLKSVATSAGNSRNACATGPFDPGRACKSSALTAIE
jgi:hypothetical protein